jgi:hypothetical protein
MRPFIQAFLGGLLVAALSASGQALNLVADGDFSNSSGSPWYVFSPVAGAYSTSDGSPDSPSGYAADGGSLVQTTGHVIAAGESYTVSYLAAWLSGGSTSGISAQVSLESIWWMPSPIAGASQTINLTNLGDWQSHQFVFTAVAGQDYIGKELGIVLACPSGANSPRVGFDTLSIEVSQTPEPGTLVLLATGLLSLLAFARHKRPGKRG